MPLQAGSFKPLPSKEEMLKIIENEKKRKLNIASFMPLIKAVADRFGDKAYAVAAKSLTKSGFKVNASELKKTAKELRAGQKASPCAWVT